MNRTKALLAGSTVAGLTSAYVGGVGISALGGAIGVGFIPTVAIGGLLTLGAWEVYKAGERKGSIRRDVLEQYDKRKPLIG